MFFLFYPTPTPPLLYIHLSPIHQLSVQPSSRFHPSTFPPLPPPPPLRWLMRDILWHTPDSSRVSLKVLQGFPGTIWSRRGTPLHPPSLNLSIIFMKVQLKHVVHRLECECGSFFFYISHCSATPHLLPHRTEPQGHGPHHQDKSHGCRAVSKNVKSPFSGWALEFKISELLLTEENTGLGRTTDKD